MAEQAAEIFVMTLEAYAVIGSLFAVAFVSVGAKRVDPQTIGSSVGFRFLLLPGVAALWPLLLRRWIRGSSEAPEEENPRR